MFGPLPTPSSLYCRVFFLLPPPRASPHHRHHCCRPSSVAHTPPPSFSSLARAAIFDCCVVICYPSYCLHCCRHVECCHRCLLLLPPPPIGWIASSSPQRWLVFVCPIYSHRRRSVVGKHRPQLANIAVRNSLSSLLTTHAHRRPCAFGWMLGEGTHGRKYPMHCLIVVVMVVHHPFPPSSVSVVNCPLSTIESSTHLLLLLLNPQHCCHLRLERLIVVYID